MQILETAPGFADPKRAKTDWLETDDAASRARQAIENARAKPVSADDIARAPTDHANSDGFVTFDELIAMKRAGLDDEDMLEQLRPTGQVFDLTPNQKQALIDAGISPYVAMEMTRIKQSERNRMLADAPTE